MLIILPPSETKAHGGTGDPLNWDSLSFPALNPVRKEIAQILSDLEVTEAMGILKISEKLRSEAESNRQIFQSPTMPAIERFTGVLFDALEPATLSTHARARLAVGDALFGLIRADDPIPHYRLSGSSKLQGKTMKSRWGKLISQELANLDSLVIDMRSGIYQQLGKYPTAVTVRVESVQANGTRKVVSHFNKHYKGELARILAQSPQLPVDIDQVAELAQEAGMVVEIRGKELVLVV